MKSLACALLIACQQSKPEPAPPPIVAPAVKAFADGFSPAIVGVVVPVPVIPGDYGMALDMSYAMFVTPELKTTAERHGVLELGLATDHRIHGCIAIQRSDGARGQYHYEPDPAKRLGYRGTHDARVAAIGGFWKTVAGITTISIDRMWQGGCDELGPAPVAASIELQCIATAKTAKLLGQTLLCQEPAGDPVGLGMPLNVAIDDGSHMIAPLGTQLVLAPGGLSMKFAVDNGPTAKFSITPQALIIDPAAYK